MRYSFFPFILGLIMLVNPVQAQQPEGQLHLHLHAVDADYDQDLLPASFHRQRREELRKLMPDNSVALFFSAPVRNRSNDVDYHYHQNPSFYYYTGFTEPDAVVVIFKKPRKIDGIETNEIIFVRERNPQSEMWDGKRLGTEGVKQKLEFPLVYSHRAFSTIELGFEGFDKILILPPFQDVKDDKNDPADLYSLQQQFREKTESLSKKAVNRIVLPELTARLREVKTPEEIVLLRKAIDITCKAQLELMRGLRPGMKEYQTAAIVEYVFKFNGAEYEGFPSIQGGGENSCVLHYTSNRKTLRNKDLLVSDIGAEYHGYTADVTRTLPVRGYFTPEEKELYNLVLKAQTAGIAECKSGNSFWSAHRIAQEIITQGLLDLGIIREPGEVKRYFPHGTSHYLGLDVHDAGTYGALKPGTVLTVEPGIYIPEGSPCDPKWWNIGIRIEDDILVTEQGPENLSACVPRTIEEIERIMAEKSSLEEFIEGK